MFEMLGKLFGGGASIPSVDAATYKNDYYGKNDHLLIDVRTAGEFKSGHIPGAKNIPLDQLSNQLQQIPRDKTLIIVCQSGNRSRTACNLLLRAGYENAINFKGGTIRWRMGGNPLT